ncbi:hypothetical protein LTR95_007406 [Oleoguttula sp. CCFEE 5521]
MQLRERLTSAGQQYEAGLLGRGSVDVRHPGYPDDPGAILLSLPATDDESGLPGVDHGTTHVACAIIANNRFDGYLSRSPDPGADHKDVDHMTVLPAATYYFHIPPSDHIQAQARADSQAVTPYPVVPNFRAWKFPRAVHIPHWQDIGVRDGGLLDGTEGVLSRDGQRCRLTDSRESIQAAHLVPKAEGQWFEGNAMQTYWRGNPTAGPDTIDKPVNGITLRQDVHRSWDASRLFFVPKKSDGASKARLVVHVAAWSSELLALYHNVELQELRGLAWELLFVRFAYGILPQIRTFLGSGQARWLIVPIVNGLQETKIHCWRLRPVHGGPGRWSQFSKSYQALLAESFETEEGGCCAGITGEAREDWAPSMGDSRLVIY